MDNVIFSYSTKEAVQDRVLFEVDNAISKEAGIKFPVYMTSRVWRRYVEVPTGMKHQDLDGRLWDVLFMFAFQARKSPSSKMFFSFVCQIPANLMILPNEGITEDSDTLRNINLKAVIGPRDIDDPTPGIFIMFSEED